MFHFENEKIENTEKPQEYKKEGDSGWLNIPFKEKNKGETTNIVSHLYFVGNLARKNA